MKCSLPDIKLSYSDPEATLTKYSIMRVLIRESLIDVYLQVIFKLIYFLFIVLIEPT